MNRRLPILAAAFVLLTGLLYYFLDHSWSVFRPSKHDRTPSMSPPPVFPIDNSNGDFREAEIGTREFDAGLEQPHTSLLPTKSSRVRLDFRIPDPSTFGYEVWNIYGDESSILSHGSRIETKHPSGSFFKSTVATQTGNPHPIVGSGEVILQAPSFSVVTLLVARGVKYGRTAEMGELYIFSGAMKWEAHLAKGSPNLEILLSLQEPPLTIDLGREAALSTTELRIVAKNHDKLASTDRIWPFWAEVPDGASPNLKSGNHDISAALGLDASGRAVVHGLPRGFGVVDMLTLSGNKVFPGSYYVDRPIDPEYDFQVNQSVWVTLPPRDRVITFGQAGPRHFPAIEAILDDRLSDYDLSDLRIYCRAPSMSRDMRIAYAVYDRELSSWGWFVTGSPRPFMNSVLQFELAGPGVQSVVIDGTLAGSGKPLQFPVRPIENGWSLRLELRVPEQPSLRVPVMYSVKIGNAIVARGAAVAEDGVTLDPGCLFEIGPNVALDGIQARLEIDNVQTQNILSKATRAINANIDGSAVIIIDDPLRSNGVSARVIIGIDRLTRTMTLTYTTRVMAHHMRDRVPLMDFLAKHRLMETYNKLISGEATK